MKFSNPLIFLLALPALALAEDEHGKKMLTLQDLPPQVASAMQQAAGRERLKEISHGDEDGQPAYEAVWSAKGLKHEITVADNGQVLSTEAVIALTDAPAVVQGTISREAKGGIVEKVEKADQKGFITYEAEIKTKSGKMDLTIDAAGKVTKQETDTEAEDGKKD